MARKGRATIKTPDKYITVDSDSGEESPSVVVSKQRSRRKSTRPEGENVDPVASRDGLNLSKAPGPQDGRRQPRQDARTGGQSTSLAGSLFPDNHSDADFPSIQPTHTTLSFATDSQNQPKSSSRAETSARRVRTTGPARGQGRDNTDDSDMSNKPIQGGAYIPPNQQRNMRACMVCSVVRTQQQFLTEGCPNCEDVLELAGNPEQINDCTSQVFDGLISVSDTSRSWVARYQRLEGYRPGVYATQVEGILPEDVIGLVESAGINYVPRDGSEQDTLPRD
ncbi:SPT4 Transcription elongation factor SPT4 [Pyrenophora tritici-repentis]|uniref:Transcription elongation factor SPT4 n=2 Tax=Pyrenophora tritici-repentis TaxID=45151 RepID=A0A2W1DEL0_9PLEO|nr:transcription elongation factor spt4 [Pyrenophora tritici-repentis Pt-1C-BFP]KAA8620327.1 Transcription elongation factor SPT4 [Pyrenophora tritici-repentis]EDU46457.1 transcription elongation factor spt4 [Pyrenophora tritici-repentis Pt-1C-BFP]KAF7448480.1 Transcription elongation factor SPT4 [Pyrenophora tritici-repentis]KAF7572202.1 SPT4, Transcription elongation factor SPT4 [Pyrenophora tritici-repentis]KAG9384617.1 Transcription elongation factor SPT4 [Pyrenophora tritici-repentis]